MAENCFNAVHQVLRNGTKCCRTINHQSILLCQHRQSAPRETFVKGKVDKLTNKRRQHQRKSTSQTTVTSMQTFSSPAEVHSKFTQTWIENKPVESYLMEFYHLVLIGTDSGFE
ncbi:unnamed protein product [Clavelina lepadiformis]|uniref:Uncharacterized protein n=1 Tax=Clavelina lepadiformis TaxID=159417 RepID=A0ABP0GLB4_CLALP